MGFVIANLTNFIVNRNTSLKFSITLADSINSNSLFQITFPTGTNLVSSSTLQGSYTISNRNINGSNIKFSLNIGNIIINPSVTLNFTFNFFRAPTSTLPTSNITAAILVNNSYSQIGYTTLTASPNTLSFNITPIVSTININTTYSFSIVILDSLSSNGMIKIDFPT
jgi:hypothetical protein